MVERAQSPRLHDFFLTMARKSFGELGVGDQAIVGYVAAVMTEFARADRLYALRTASGHTIDSVVQMLVETDKARADDPSIECTREARRYVGDYSLFMSGLFRTHVEKDGALEYYMEEGRRSYWAVSELDLTMFRTGFLMFQQLSTNFEYYSGALDYMRKAYFAPQPSQSPFDQFLHEVEGWIATGLSSN
jgi:hypothetical protein